MAAFGVYVHIPFCSHRCDYCAFATWSDRHHLHDDYLDAVAIEIQRAIDDGMHEATSIFVGGGTPSLVEPERLAAIIASVPAIENAEITVECNPESLTENHVAAYRSAGVNRLSFGVQSMSEQVLQSLGRQHDPRTAEQAVAFARSGGIERVNLDLIYGGAGESLENWGTTIRKVVALDPEHVSAYALTVEGGTPLADDPSRHPDDDDQADKYLLADKLLGEAGYENYEISNWSKPGEQCEHNLLYWRQGNYRGFGCAAHSHEDGRRWWNVRTPDRFIELIAEGNSVESASEQLDPQRQRIEGLQLSLRTSGGVPIDSLSVEDLDVLEPLVTISDGVVRLRVEGRLLANEVAVRLR